MLYTETVLLRFVWFIHRASDCALPTLTSTHTLPRRSPRWKTWYSLLSHSPGNDVQPIDDNKSWQRRGRGYAGGHDPVVS